MANQDRTGGDKGRNQPNQGGHDPNHPGGRGSFNQGSQDSDTMTRERGEREPEREEERGQRSQIESGGHDSQGSRNR